MTLPVGATVEVALAELREHPENPRRISRARLEQLKRSLAADPGMLEARPLIALRDGTVIAGNMRLRAAIALGWSSIPVRVVALDDATARLWMLRDNNSFGEWDTATLAEMLASLSSAGVDVDLAGFDTGELDELLAGPVRRGDEDDAPPVPPAPTSRPGEVYDLGPHRLICGDARDGGALRLLLQGDPADLIVTDPPYGVGYAEKADTLTGHGGRGDSRIAGDDLAAGDLEALIADALLAACEHARSGSPIYVFHSESTSPVFRRAFDAAGWRYAQTLIWVKNQLVLGRQDYQWQHEPILYGWKPGAAHRWYADAAETTIVDDGVDYRKLSKPDLVQLVHELRAGVATTLIREAKPAVSDLHPTMKPVRLLERLIRNSSRRGGTVLDPFAGAGATLIAADKLGRHARLVEIDPGYCDVIRARWEAWNA